MSTTCSSIGRAIACISVAGRASLMCSMHATLPSYGLPASRRFRARGRLCSFQMRIACFSQSARKAGRALRSGCIGSLSEGFHPGTRIAAIRDPCIPALRSRIMPGTWVPALCFVPAGTTGERMPGLDTSRQFIPLKIAVLTVSDTRSLDEDKSGATLAERIEKAGHTVGARAVVTDDVEKIRMQVKTWIADPAIDVVITTGGTGFPGRDVTPEALEPLFEKRMEGFSTLFVMVSYAKIGTSAIQTRATAGVAGATYIFCLPGSPGACKDAWDEILVHQLDYRYRPCNFVEIMPRLDEHLRRAKAQGATVSSNSLPTVRVQLELPRLTDQSFSELIVLVALGEPEAGPLIDMAPGCDHVVAPQRDLAVAGFAGKAHGFVAQPCANAKPARVWFDQEKT